MIITNNCNVFSSSSYGLPELAFGEVSEVFDEMNTLNCLVEFDLVVSKLNRNAMLPKLESILIAGKNYSGSLADKKAKLLEMIKALSRIPNGLPAYYESKLNAITSEEDFQKCLDFFRLNVKSISFTSPLFKSCKGANGPTFLVSYPRLDSNFENPQIQNYVLKYTDWNEICCTRIYDVFSKQCANPFFVPKASAFDFKCSGYEKIDCSKEQLTCETAQKFKSNFDGIRLALCPKVNPKHEQIMIMERVTGSNLYDFIKKKYQELTHEQKLDLYRTLGKLAMMDIFLGHEDRLVRFNEYNFDPSKGVHLVPWESNLANVMVKLTSKKRDGLCMYAIDNGIDHQLIREPKYNADYNAFLEKFLRTEQMQERLAYYEEHFKDQKWPNKLPETPTSSIELEKIKSIEELEERSKRKDRKHRKTAMVVEGIISLSIKKDIKIQMTSEDNKNVNLFNEIKREFKLFSKDLKSKKAKYEILAGLFDMSIKLNEVLLPFWENGQSYSLKEYLLDTRPDLLEVISGRFEVLNSFNRSNNVDKL